ncbi:MAG: methyltransferase domain-containing protein [Burkholderiaceae bacterium]|nr:MAG: methyltransferase domain-containing protein [Burkholderiaceae bacterium]
MEKAMEKIEFVRFNARQDRTFFVAKRFSQYLNERVLDVGCFEAPLRGLLKPGTYIGVDMAGAPDVHLNLDSAERLPFGDGEFPTVICIEVLEHLENLHRMFGELVRVSQKHLIVSLPNCWRDARRPIERGKGDFAHYGLPVEKPLDRHRWFFGYGQARTFLNAMADKYHLKVTEIFATEQPRNRLVRFLRRLRYSRDAYANRYVQTIWVVFSREG